MTDNSALNQVDSLALATQASDSVDGKGMEGGTHRRKCMLWLGFLTLRQPTQ